MSAAPQILASAFRPTPVESPGGGRVRDKRDPAPSDIMRVHGKNGAVPLHRLAAQAWAAMLCAARADGIAAPLLLIVSGYRSSRHQARLWAKARAKYGSPEEARKWVAPPGSSAHQSGRAVDLYLGTSNDSRNVAALRRTPAYLWLVANAQRFGFYPYEREPWHWEYNPPATPEQREFSGAVSAGRMEVASVPVLARHAGSGPALVLRWNDMPAAPAEVDVVIHLHGYNQPRMTLPNDIEPISGLDLGGRSRPTVGILPRGHFTGVQMRRGRAFVYTFPALDGTNGRRDGVARLVNFSLERFAATAGGSPPRCGRLILTAHSGGGQPVLRILRFVDPQEVHIYDGLYGSPDTLAAWARRHLQQDRAAATPGGAMRVFFGPSTTRFSRELRAAIAPHLTRELARRYRVEETAVPHNQIPRRFGRRILADASADVR